MYCLGVVLAKQLGLPRIENSRLVKNLSMTDECTRDADVHLPRPRSFSADITSRQYRPDRVSIGGGGSQPLLSR